MKRAGSALLFVVMLAAAYWLLSHFNILPSFSSIFKAKPVTIDETPVLLEEVKKLSQLVTITVFDEVVVQQEKTTNRPLNSPGSLLPLSIKSTGRLVLIGRGRVMAGINLEKTGEKDCFIKGDSVSVLLPPAAILQVIVNPSDFETFSETGSWTPEEVTAVKLKLKEKLTERALQQGVLEKAGSKGAASVKQFLQMLGFKRIHVSLRS